MTNSLGLAGPKRLRHEECQVIGLEKKQKSDDAKELGLDPVSDSQQDSNVNISVLELNRIFNDGKIKYF